MHCNDLLKFDALCSWPTVGRLCPGTNPGYVWEASDEDLMWNLVMTTFMIYLSAFQFIAWVSESVLFCFIALSQTVCMKITSKLQK